MGSSQSKFSEADLQEQLAQRLKAFELNDSNVSESQRDGVTEKGYVFVEGEGTNVDQSRMLCQSRLTEQWEKELLEDPKNRLAIAAFTANAAKSIISSRAAKIADAHIFNVSIPFEGAPVTNQRSSGRCWLFAATNVFRIALMKIYHLKEFELSQAYLYYWDKIEKANYFLENILETVDEPLDGRLIQDLLSAPVNDGGQWDMVANLVSKYGLVPQRLYPDSYNAMNSSVMNKLITTKLREDALKLRALATNSKSSAQSLASAKTVMMREIHLILTLMLGPPPSPATEFTWEFYDSLNRYQKVMVSPLRFAAQLSDSMAVKALGGTDVHTLFSLVHDPRNEFETLLTVDRLGNVWGGRRITYVNVKMSTLKAACVEMLRRGLPVFFGSDVDQFSTREGIMDLNLYDWSIAFNIKLGMSKAERLMTLESQMTHAMVLTAVDIEDGKPVRWRVENSWSDTAGDKGYFVMQDSWMDEFVYQVVVSPSVVTKEVTDVLKMEPKVLPHWDPDGRSGMKDISSCAWPANSFQIPHASLAYGDEVLRIVDGIT